MLAWPAGADAASRVELLTVLVQVVALSIGRHIKLGGRRAKSCFQELPLLCLGRCWRRAQRWSASGNPRSHRLKHQLSQNEDAPKQHPMSKMASMARSASAEMLEPMSSPSAAPRAPRGHVAPRATCAARRRRHGGGACHGRTAVVWSGLTLVAKDGRGGGLLLAASAT